MRWKCLTLNYWHKHIIPSLPTFIALSAQPTMKNSMTRGRGEVSQGARETVARTRVRSIISRLSLLLSMLNSTPPNRHSLINEILILSRHFRNYSWTEEEILTRQTFRLQQYYWPAIAPMSRPAVLPASTQDNCSSVRLARCLRSGKVGPRMPTLRPCTRQQRSLVKSLTSLFPDFPHHIHSTILMMGSAH